MSSGVTRHPAPTTTGTEMARGQSGQEIASGHGARVGRVQPFLLINAGSGGGRTQDSITAVATDLALAHHVVEPGDDFDAVLGAALDRGADLLAAAGGDGTLSAVANVAMDHDLPMVVVPAGTR